MTTDKPCPTTWRCAVRHMDFLIRREVFAATKGLTPARRKLAFEAATAAIDRAWARQEKAGVPESFPRLYASEREIEEGDES